MSLPLTTLLLLFRVWASTCRSFGFLPVAISGFDPVLLPLPPRFGDVVVLMEEELTIFGLLKDYLIYYIILVIIALT